MFDGVYESVCLIVWQALCGSLSLFVESLRSSLDAPATCWKLQAPNAHRHSVTCLIIKAPHSSTFTHFGVLIIFIYYLLHSLTTMASASSVFQKQPPPTSKWPTIFFESISHIRIRVQATLNTHPLHSSARFEPEPWGPQVVPINIPVAPAPRT